MESKLNEKIIAISVEANGILGQPFIISIAKMDTATNEAEEIIWRCRIEEPVTYATSEVLWPKLNHIPVTYDFYINMLRDFAKWWLKNKEGATLVYQSGFVTESFLFRELYNHKLIKEYDIPDLTVDILPMLRSLGYPFYTREQYCIDNDLDIHDDGSIERDALVILKIYLHSILNKKQQEYKMPVSDEKESLGKIISDYFNRQNVGEYTKKDEMHIKTIDLWSKYNSKCEDVHEGCLIAKHDRIVATGYSKPIDEQSPCIEYALKCTSCSSYTSMNHTFSMIHMFKDINEDIVNGGKCILIPCKCGKIYDLTYKYILDNKSKYIIGKNYKHAIKDAIEYIREDDELTKHDLEGTTVYVNYVPSIHEVEHLIKYKVLKVVYMGEENTESSSNIERLKERMHVMRVENDRVHILS